MAKIVIYTTLFCPYCDSAKQLLTRKGASFEEVDVTCQPDARLEMTRKAGRTSVPQIWIGEFHVGGCDELYALERKGRLDPLLAA
ncbi:MAG: glutaredoxin 3 [Hyphomicrobiaceae bacterium]|nr:MAG: glutaredoxin 3 [Hyphomicrobiaceae bacterium]